MWTEPKQSEAQVTGYKRPYKVYNKAKHNANKESKYGFKAVFGTDASDFFAQCETECQNLHEIFSKPETDALAANASFSTKSEQPIVAEADLEEDEFIIKRHPAKSEDFGSINIADESGSSIKFEQLSDEPMEGYEVGVDSPASLISKPITHLGQSNDSFESYKSSLAQFCFGSQQN